MTSVWKWKYGRLLFIILLQLLQLSDIKSDGEQSVAFFY